MRWGKVAEEASLLPNRVFHPSTIHPSTLPSAHGRSWCDLEAGGGHRPLSSAISNYSNTEGPPLNRWKSPPHWPPSPSLQLSLSSCFQALRKPRFPCQAELYPTPFSLFLHEEATAFVREPLHLTLHGVNAFDWSPSSSC